MDPPGVVRQRHHGQGSSNENNDNTSSAASSRITESTPTSPGTPAKSVWRRMSTGLGSSLLPGDSAGSEDSYEHVRGYDLFRKEKWDEFPQGFPRLSSFVSSSDELSMVRGFKTIHNRILLHYQVEITELEKDLFKLDNEDVSNPQTSHRLRRTKHQDNWNSAQRDLLQKLRVMVKEYDEMVLYHKSMQDLLRASKRNHMKYWNFMWRTQPLAEGYWDYIYWADDFVTLSGSRTNPFQEFLLDHLSKWRWSPFRWILRQNENNKPAKDQAATYYSKTGLQIVSRFLLVTIAVGLVLVPANILFLVPMSRSKMAGTVAACMFPFGFLMAAMTKNMYEVFAVIAAYGAVLVMFQGNLVSSTACDCATAGA